MPMLNLYKGGFSYRFTELKITRVGSDGGEVPVVEADFWNTFKRSYSYYSSTVDGQFGLPPGPHQGPLEEFILYIPHPICYGDTDYSFHNSQVPGPLVTVSGGAVTDFSLNSEIGPVGLTFGFGAFTISKSAGDDWSYHVKGEISFRNPKLVSKGVLTKPKNVKVVVS